jgi:hypothetical protein
MSSRPKAKNEIFPMVENIEAQAVGHDFNLLKNLLP